MDTFAAYHAPYIIQRRAPVVVRITAEDIAGDMFVGTDRNVLDPAITPYVLVTDRNEREIDRPCQLWIDTRDDAGNLLSEAVMGSFDEPERTCDAANTRSGGTREQVDRIVPASMGGGTA